TLAGVAKIVRSHAACTVSPASASRHASDEPCASACAVSSPARRCSALRWASRSRTALLSSKPQISDALNPAVSMTKKNRPTPAKNPLRERRSTRAQTVRTSKAADRAAIHTGERRKTNARTCGSTRPITTPYRQRNIRRATKYGLASALMPAPIHPRTANVTHKDWRQSGAKTIARRSSAFDVELTFLGDPLECLASVLDPVLVVFAVGRQQAHNLIATARSGPADRARRIGYRLANLELMRSQRLADGRDGADADAELAGAGLADAHLTDADAGDDARVDLGYARLGDASNRHFAAVAWLLLFGRDARVRLAGRGLTRPCTPSRLRRPFFCP